MSNDCVYYAEIGSGCCDRCGGPPRDHIGMLVLKPDAGPFGGGDDCWEGVTWEEWGARVEEAKQVRRARRALADLSDEQAIALAATLGGGDGE